MRLLFTLSLVCCWLAQVPLAFAPKNTDAETEATRAVPKSKRRRLNESADTAQASETPLALPEAEPLKASVCLIKPRPPVRLNVTQLVANKDWEGMRDSLLQHPGTLRLIMQCLDVTDLKACRRVCNQWYRQATYVLTTHPNFKLCFSSAAIPAMLPPVQLQDVPSVATAAPLTASAVVGLLDAMATPSLGCVAMDDERVQSDLVAPERDRRIETFLAHLQRYSSQSAWTKPSHPLQIKVCDKTDVVLQTLQPLALKPESWEGVLNPTSLENVRHIDLLKRSLSTHCFRLLKGTKIETLNLEGSKMVPHNTTASIDEMYQAFFELSHLVTLTDLNLEYFYIRYLECDRAFGWLIEDKIRRQLGLEEGAPFLPQHDGVLIAANPLSSLTGLKKLTIGSSQFHQAAFLTCLQALESLHVGINWFRQEDHKVLASLQNLQELSLRNPSFLFGAPEVGHPNGGIKTYIHQQATPLTICPNLRVLYIRGGYGVDNLCLKRLKGVKKIEEFFILGSKIKSYKNKSGWKKRGDVPLSDFSLKKLTIVDSLEFQHFSAFATMTQLTHLDLSECALDQAACVKALEALIHLEYLDLCDSGIPLSGLWSSMKNLTKLRYLNLSQRLQQDYNEEQQAACAQVLSQNSQLAKLDLSWHHIGFLTEEPLKNLYLEQLALQCCDLTDEALKVWPLLNCKNLNLALNRLSSDSVVYIAEALKAVHQPHLRVLNLGNNKLSEASLDALQSMTFLDELWLPQCCFTDEQRQNFEQNFKQGAGDLKTVRWW